MNIILCAIQCWHQIVNCDILLAHLHTLCSFSTPHTLLCPYHPAEHWGLSIPAPSVHLSPHCKCSHLQWIASTTSAHRREKPSLATLSLAWEGSKNIGNWNTVESQNCLCCVCFSWNWETENQLLLQMFQSSSASVCWCCSSGHQKHLGKWSWCVLWLLPTLLGLWWTRVLSWERHRRWREPTKMNSAVQSSGKKYRGRLPLIWPPLHAAWCPD